MNGVISLVERRNELERLNTQIRELTLGYARAAARYTELYAEWLELKEVARELREENARLRNEARRRDAHR